MLLKAAALIRPRASFKLLILAGGSFEPFAGEVRRLGLEDQVIVREKVTDIEEYLQAADLAVFTSDVESFCLGILEAMFFACPSVARRVGGIPEVVEHGVTGLLVDSSEAGQIATAIESLIQDPARRTAFGRVAQKRAQDHFSMGAIVPRYEALYARVARAVYYRQTGAECSLNHRQSYDPHKVAFWAAKTFWNWIKDG